MICASGKSTGLSSGLSRPTGFCSRGFNSLLEYIFFFFGIIPSDFNLFFAFFRRQTMNWRYHNLLVLIKNLTITVRQQSIIHFCVFPYSPKMVLNSAEIFRVVSTTAGIKASMTSGVILTLGAVTLSAATTLSPEPKIGPPTQQSPR
jgi:hypothetical protein